MCITRLAWHLASVAFGSCHPLSLIFTDLSLSLSLISHCHLPQVDADEKEEADKKQAAEQEPAAESESSEDQPATLKKAQDAAAARKDGEEVGSSGKHTVHLCPPVIIVLLQLHALDKKRLLTSFL